jgi:HlyD family secretion protein
MKKKIIYIIIGVIAIVIALILFKSFNKASKNVSIETEIVKTGNISNIITATGTLEALETVEVGTQVSGVIEKIYVDYNSIVKKGQLLAKLDETPLMATLEQSKASVDNAQAEVDYQKSTFDRYKALKDKNMIAQSEYDLASYNYHKALASLKNSKSVHEKNKINLAYATIYSPIDGIILERAVDEGQTVAASFSTPTLFTIANDLTQMQVEASVDEADIGRLKVNQRVEFSVDAYPSLNFDGKVTQIRLLPVESSNVITYTVVIDAPNPDNKLMPGMTANVSFFVTEKKDVILLPSGALSFHPGPQQWQEYQKSHPEITVQPPQPPHLAKQNMEEQPPLVWVKKDNIITNRKVELGETDDIYYEVISGIKAGDEVIMDLDVSEKVKPEKPAQAGQSPFMPTPPGRNRNKK